MNWGHLLKDVLLLACGAGVGIFVFVAYFAITLSRRL